MQPFAHRETPCVRPLARLGLLCVTALLLGVGCGRSEAPPPGVSLLAEPPAPEVLVEERTVSGPRSERPNRFFQGWSPTKLGGRRGFRAAAGGATLQVVTLTPRDRTLVMDLAVDEEAPQPGHVRVRLDRDPVFLVPFADPLSVPIPGDLSGGRHLVELSLPGSNEVRLLVLGAAVRPVAGDGSARIEGEDLVLEGPSVTEVVAAPQEGWALTGRLCPRGALASTRGMSVEVAGTSDRVLARWTGDGGLVDRLRGCRRIELPPLPAAEPVRVRFQVDEPGSGARWRGWRWTTPPAAGPASRVRPHRPSHRPRLVVLYVMDALRADAVGHLGGPAGVSPTIDRMAREGFTFRAHRSTAPNTLLSIRHLFTGRILVNHDAWKRLGVHLPTLAEAFRAAGYRTGLFSGNGYVSAHFGLARGFEHVSQEALFNFTSAGPPGVNRNAERVHAAALRWLDTVPEDAPVFLYLHTIHPHNPYAPPSDLEARFTAGIASAIHGDTKTLRDLLRGRRTASPADRERLRGLYLASLAYNDAQLARLLEALRRRFPEDESLVFLTADHGDELFDHGGVLHGYTLYEELLHVPLVVWGPGSVRPGETREVTDALDLHATLVELASGAGDADGEGRSLLPLLRGDDEALPSRLHFAASEGIPGGIFAVRSGRWKHVWARGTERTWAMGLGSARSWDREYLFDLAADPGERRNLAGTFSVREDWLRARLRSWVRAQIAELRAAGEPEADEPALDETERQRLRALGYVD